MNLISNKKLNVFSVNESFKKVFKDWDYKESDTEIKSRIIPVPMDSEQILRELSPREFTVNQVLSAIHSDKPEINRCGVSNLFVVSTESRKYIISAIYQKIGDGGSWGIHLHDINNLSDWGQGRNLIY